jgi:prophage antirepressor-like protein
MNELQIFNHETFGQVRVVFIDGEPWLVLRDVCDALGLADTNMTAKRLDDDELTQVKLVSGGQNREMYVISESGLYSVILRSDKPEAKEFRRWVTHDILPEIRKAGAYIPNCAEPSSLTGATTYMKLLYRSMESQGHTPREIAVMIALVAKQYNLPIPGGFVRESPFEQMRLVYNVPKG